MKARSRAAAALSRADRALTVCVTPDGQEGFTFTPVPHSMAAPQSAR